MLGASASRRREPRRPRPRCVLRVLPPNPNAQPAPSPAPASSPLKQTPSAQAMTRGGVKAPGTPTSFFDLLPSNVCDIWHHKSTSAEEEKVEFYADARQCRRGVYAVDCGYDTATDGNETDDVLAWYVHGGSALADQSVTGDSPTHRRGLITDLIDTVCSRGAIASVTFFAINSMSKDVVDLVAPFTSNTRAVHVQASAADPANINTELLSRLSVSDSASFMRVYRQMTASLSFRQTRAKLSFGFVIQTNAECHTVLLCRQRHHQDLVRIIAEEPIERDEATLRSLHAKDVLRHIRYLMAAANPMDVPPEGDGPLLAIRVPESIKEDTLGVSVLVAECSREVRVSPISMRQRIGETPPRQIQSSTPQRRPPTNEGQQALVTTTTGTTPKGQLSGGVLQESPRGAKAVTQLLHEKDVCLEMHNDILKQTDMTLTTVKSTVEKLQKKRAHCAVTRAELDSLYAANAAARERVSRTRAAIAASKDEMASIQTEVDEVIDVVKSTPAVDTTASRAALIRENNRRQELLSSARRDHGADLDREQRDGARTVDRIQAEAGAKEQRILAEIATLEVQVKSADEASRIAKEAEKDAKLRIDDLEATEAEVKKLILVAKEAVQTAAQRESAVTHRRSEHEALETEVDGLSVELMDLKNNVEALQKDVTDKQTEIDKTVSSAQLFRSRIQQNVSGLKESKQLVLQRREAAVRKILFTQRARWIQTRFRDWMSVRSRYMSHFTTPTAEMEVERANAKRSEIATQRREVDSTTAALDQHLDTLLHELETVLQVQETDLQRMQEDAHLGVRKIADLRAELQSNELGRRKELQAAQAAYDSLYKDFLAFLHTETERAMAKVAKQRRDAKRRHAESPEPSDPMSKRSTPAESRSGSAAALAQFANTTQSFANATTDDVCQLFLKWMTKREVRVWIDDETARLRQTTLSVQGTLERAAADLQRDRELLGELTAYEDEQALRERQAAEDLERLAGEQGQHRMEMESAIVRLHEEGNAHVTSAARDLEASTIVLEDLERQLADSRREANLLVSEIELAESGTTAELQRRLDATVTENASLELQAASARRDRIGVESTFLSSSGPNVSAVRTPSRAGRSTPPPPITPASPGMSTHRTPARATTPKQALHSPAPWAVETGSTLLRKVSADLSAEVAAAADAAAPPPSVEDRSTALANAKSLLGHSTSGAQQ